MTLLERPWAGSTVVSSQVCTLASSDCPLRCGLPGGREPPDGIKLYFKEIELFMRTMTLEAQALKLPHHITITNSNTVITSKSSGSWRPPPFLKNPRLNGFASTAHSFPSTLHNLFTIRKIDRRVNAMEIISMTMARVLPNTAISKTKTELLSSHNIK